MTEPTAADRAPTQPSPRGPGPQISMRSLLPHFTSPSEAFWRLFELLAIREQCFSGPVLELGCGDGGFTELAGLYVDEAIDLNPRAVERALA
jgi:hypothetical protein